MASKDLLLALDNGTQSFKALVFDPLGNLKAKSQVAFEPYYASQPGWAEQDPEVFWDALCQACQSLWHEHGVDKNSLAAVSLTTQRGTVINVDRNGRCLRPAITWLDQRKANGLRPLGFPWGWIFKLIRKSGTIHHFRSEAEANWIAAHQPEIWKQTHKFLLLSGFLTYRLIGQFLDSVGSQVGYIPFDYKKLRWAPAWDWKWRCLAVQPHMLPELVPPATTLGHITRRAAGQTGIPADLPLIAAAADKACEVIGSGALASDIGCLSYGTTATINVTHARYIEPVPLLPAYPSAVPDYHTVEIQVFRGYWMVNWFKQEFGFPELAEARRRGVPPETLFEGLLEQIPPGSMGLLLQPYWSPGVKSPGPEAKGSIVGFGDVHTRAHLYRAILEGLAYALREGRERIETRSGTPITSLRVSGGGSQSRAALQLTADIFGLPAIKPHVFETAGLGAAIDAAVGIGFYSDFPSAVWAMTRAGEFYEPNREHQRQYDELFTQVYKKLYKRLKPLYERIRKITGYPQ